MLKKVFFKMYFLILHRFDLIFNLKRLESITENVHSTNNLDDSMLNLSKNDFDNFYF